MKGGGECVNRGLKGGLLVSFYSEAPLRGIFWTFLSQGPSEDLLEEGEALRTAERISMGGNFRLRRS